MNWITALLKKLRAHPESPTPQVPVRLDQNADLLQKTHALPANPTPQAPDRLDQNAEQAINTTIDAVIETCMKNGCWMHGVPRGAISFSRTHKAITFRFPLYGYDCDGKHTDSILLSNETLCPWWQADKLFRAMALHFPRTTFLTLDVGFWFKVPNPTIIYQTQYTTLDLEDHVNGKRREPREYWKVTIDKVPTLTKVRA